MWWAKGCPGTDVEDYIEDLRAQGWDEEAIALERADAARLREPGSIWPEGWVAAQVFSACSWTLLPSFAGPPRWVGIGSQEIEAVCRMHRVPVRDRQEVTMLVRMMANAAAPVLNERNT